MSSVPTPVESPVLVVGTGLVGTSVALGLTAAGVQVHLRDVDAENVQLAVGLGAGTDAPVEAPAIVVLAVPPSVLAAEVEAALAEFPDAVITDVGSVKQAVCSAIMEPRFVGGHPMAGKERSGPLAGSARLFEGRPWAIVPTEYSSAAAIAAVEDLARTLGAVTVRLEAESHDRAVAVVSHVPHLVSNLAAGLLNDTSESQMVLAGQGLRDVTRIARSDTGLWVDIIRANAEPVAETLNELRVRLDELISIVEDKASGLDAVLARGRSGTNHIPGKHGDLPSDVTTVYVTIDDEPGELARLLVDTGDVDVNIEDVRIDHEVGRPVGLVEILVVPERAEFLAGALNSRGWTAYL